MSEWLEMEVDPRVEDLRCRRSDEDMVVDGKIKHLKGYKSDSLGVKGAPLMSKRSYRGRVFVLLGPYGFRNVIGGRRRGGSIRPSVARGGGNWGRDRRGSMGIVWISYRLGTLEPRLG